MCRCLCLSLWTDLTRPFNRRLLRILYSTVWKAIVEDVLLHAEGSTCDVSAQRWTRISQESGKLKHWMEVKSMSNASDSFNSSLTTFTTPSEYITRWQPGQTTTPKSNTFFGYRRQINQNISSKPAILRSCNRGLIQSTLFVPHFRHRRSKVSWRFCCNRLKCCSNEFLLQVVLEVKNAFSGRSCHARSRN